MVVRERFSYKAIHDVLSDLLEEDLHAKRVNSLCDATLGVLHSGSLAICTIGQGLAAARSLKRKHAIKQVDRLLSNPTTLYRCRLLPTTIQSLSGVESVASTIPSLAAFLFAVALGRADGLFLLTAALPVAPAVLASIHAAGLGDGERTVN